MPTRDSAPLGAPVWIDLSSSDPQRAKDFYGQIFGWTSQGAGAEYGNYVNFAKDGVLVAGMMKNNVAGAPDGWTTYLSSADAKASADAVLTAGGQVLMEPIHPLWPAGPGHRPERRLLQALLAPDLGTHRG